MIIAYDLTKLKASIRHIHCCNNWMEVLFAQAFLSYVGHLTLQAQDNRPHNYTVYCRYIDDIFVYVQNQDHLEQIRSWVQEIKGLPFTVEMSRNNKLCLLRVQVVAGSSNFVTDIYWKPANADKSLDGEECSQD